MSHIRIDVVLRALPVTMLAGGADSVAHEGLDCFYSPTLRCKTATPRRRFDGTAVQN